MRIADARGLWEPAGVYLNTATYGLPPRPVFEALQEAMAAWRSGRADWQAWGDETERSRTLWAGLVGARVEDVAVGATVAELMGLIAASLPAGSRIAVPEEEFTSTLFPFLVQAEESGFVVHTAPAAELAHAIRAETDAVAFSAVQMSSGEVGPIEDVLAAARHHDALVLCDATQACGWLPLDAGRFDALMCGAYKWLMAPRGSAFMAISPALRDRVVPTSANWFAAEDVHTAYFGPPLRLAHSARRLDRSPAWFSWVGTRPALELIAELGIEQIHAHDLGLANRFRAGLGLPPGDSAIASVDLAGGAEKLEAAGIPVSVRAGRLRTSWHVHNDEDDVDRVLAVLGV